MCKCIRVIKKLEREYKKISSVLQHTLTERLGCQIVIQNVALIILDTGETRYSCDVYHF